MLSTKTYTKQDTLYKTGLIGQKSRQNNNLALYLTDLDKPLNIGGKTKIVGDAKISKYGAKPAYINNQNFVGTKLIDGTTLFSSNSLPKLKAIGYSGTENIISLDYEFGQQNTIRNSFFSATKILELENERVLEDVTLSGNIIIKSNDTLFVKTTAKLDNVILEAPVIEFENEFTGNVQVFAKHNVTLNKNVCLKYPSSI